MKTEPWPWNLTDDEVDRIAIEEELRHVPRHDCPGLSSCNICRTFLEIDPMPEEQQ